MQAVRVRPTGLVAAHRPALRPAVLCKAQQKEEGKPVAAGVALLASSILLLNAAAPDVAEAARSSGRVGGSSGFKSKRVETRRSNTTVMNSTTVVPAPVMAPPVYASPFGFGGFSIMPTFVMPIPMFGGLFQFFVLMMVLGVVFSVISNVVGAASRAQKKNDDSWGDL